MESRGNEDELKAMLDTHLQQLQHVSTSGESDLDPATRSQLENMGYL